MTTTGRITGVNGNMITVKFDGAVAQNEVGYAKLGEKKLMAENLFTKNFHTFKKL